MRWIMLQVPCAVCRLCSPSSCWGHISSVFSAALCANFAYRSYATPQRFYVTSFCRATYFFVVYYTSATVLSIKLLIRQFRTSECVTWRMIRYGDCWRSTALVVTVVKKTAFFWVTEWSIKSKPTSLLKSWCKAFGPPHLGASVNKTRLKIPWNLGFNDVGSRI